MANAYENLFPNVASGAMGNEFEDEQTYENYIASLIADAVDYDESFLSPERVENMRYYDGEYPRLAVTSEEATGDIEEDDVNRSQAVSTDVQDTVMAIMPSLMRIFFSSDNVADFRPSRPDQVDKAREQTEYANYVFKEENEGFMLMHSVFKDALINKIGVATWWTEDDKKIKERTFNDLTQEDVLRIIQQWTDGDNEAQVEIVNKEDIMKGGLDEQTGVMKEVKMKYTSSTPCHRVEAVPPEEFRIDRRARTPYDALLIGRDQLLTISDVVSKGYDYEQIEEYAGDHGAYYTEEQQQRTPGVDDAIINNRLVRYGEYYIRVDRDGDGYAELRKICVVGDDFGIINDEPADYVKYAVFCGEPTPHTVIGKAMADLTKMFQNINTQLLRGALDSISSTLFPDTYVNEFTVNLEDQLNDEVGKTVRVKGDPGGAIYEHVPNFIGAQVFEMMGVINELRQRRTGISEASKGVDPRALQSTSVLGVEAIVTGAQERIELIARIFAETGFKHLMKGIIREISDHPNIKKTVELRGKWTTVDHSLFDPDMRLIVNPTLALGNDASRLQALQGIKDTQMLIMQQFGPGNVIVTPQEFMNTVEDMLAISNIKNVNRYFRPVTPELIKQLQDAPKEPSPEQLLAQAELEKVKASVVKTKAEVSQKGVQMALDEDFRRDELGLKSLVDLIEALQKGEADTLKAQALVERGNTRDVQPQ